MPLTQKEHMNEKPKINRVAVLVNLAAGGGRCRKTWALIRDAVLQRLPKQTYVIPFAGQIDLTETLSLLWEKDGINCFIAAGGDGSVHYLLHAMMDLMAKEESPFFLGAIGLGSSNDIHKPVKATIDGIPIRINCEEFTPVDVGVVDLLSEKAQRRRIFFLANASLGVTAAANHFFNEGTGLIRFLKSKWTQGAILFAAIKTILTYRNYPATLSYCGQQKAISISNLSVLKNPHLSGDLRYDQDIGPEDGRLGLNYCDNMSKKELIQTLNDLGKGRFTGRPKRHSQFVQNIKVAVNHPVPMEADGEIYMGTDFEFSLLPRGINLLSNGY